MNSKIQQVIDLLDLNAVSDERKLELQELIDFIDQKRNSRQPVRLNFICTHNSRRSQLAQMWANVAASKWAIPIESFSGGVEVTECNSRTIQSLERLGFEIEFDPKENPQYRVSFTAAQAPTILYSKLFDDPANPESGFAAVMTCSHADENCPVVPGCEKRISLRFDDPKLFDDSPLESAMYDCRSYQIATEMMYVFSKVK